MHPTTPIREDTKALPSWLGLIAYGSLLPHHVRSTSGQGEVVLGFPALLIFTMLASERWPSLFLCTRVFGLGAAVELVAPIIRGRRRRAKAKVGGPGRTKHRTMFLQGRDGIRLGKHSRARLAGIDVHFAKHSP